MRNLLLFTLFLSSLTRLNAGLAADSVSISRDSIVLFAKNYLGLPYRYASRSPARGGFDCSGYTMFVFKKFGIHLSPSSSAQSLQGDKILLKNAIPGDLVFFRRTKRGRVFHVALVSKVVKDSMAEGENIYVRGFGSFINKKRAKKIARNISKNTAIVIDEHYIPAFKPSKVFVEKIKNSKKIKQLATQD
jgi:DNA-binding protein HU-beta